MTRQAQTAELELTAEEEAAAEQIFQSIRSKAEAHLRSMARAMAAKKPREMLGRGEFELREMVLQLGAEALEAAVNDGVKKGRVSGR